METKDKRTKVVVGVLVLTGLLGILTLATAGDLEPNAPPGPTMKTLDEIYDAVIEGSSGISEREGYMKQVEVAPAPGDPCDLCTVPTGKQFVLLNVIIRAERSNPFYWNTVLTGDNLSMNSQYMRYYQALNYFGFCYEDFPDRCAVVNAGNTLRIVNYNDFAIKVKIVGYFYDVP